MHTLGDAPRLFVEGEGRKGGVHSPDTLEIGGLCPPITALHLATLDRDANAATIASGQTTDVRPSRQHAGGTGLEGRVDHCQQPPRIGDGSLSSGQSDSHPGL
jgi:hypothetical protein